tara:strand:+ start:5095 stop:6003 length:909 start_codon:yes stop_codon:yes gene_type:complete
MKFTKPAISINDQLALLRRRGMVIADEPSARHYLQHISYYRLRAYWLPFEGPAPAAGDHVLKPGTTFEDALALYVFDRQLRLLVMDAIERIEVAIRAGWAHHMAMTYGPHGYLDQAHHTGPVKHAECVADLVKETGRSKDTFVKHYNKTYEDPTLPPVWMVAEVVSLGALSKWIDNIKLRADRQAIAKPFGVDEKVFGSFAHHVTIIRNIAAHHGRLWNKRFAFTMIVPNSPARLAVAMRGADRRYLHNTLVMLDHLLMVVAPGNEWRRRVVALITSCPQVDPVQMGFPADWQGRAAWRVVV